MRARVWVVVVILVATIAAGLVGRQEAPERAAAAPAPAPAIRLPLEIAAALPSSVGSGGSGGSAPATAPPATASPEARGSESMQVCGGEWVKVDAEGHTEQAALVGLRSVRDTRSRTLARLRSSPAEIDRAIAAWLGEGPAEVAAAASAAGCTEDRCRVPQVVEAMRGPPERLARLAVSSQDPQVYALAYSACAPARQEGSCALLTPEQWARLDPGNATPWLYAMDLANARRDPAAGDEALYRIATSERENTRGFALVARILAAAPGDDASLLGSTLLAAEALGRVFAAPASYQALVRRCPAGVQSDANVQQLCAAAAERLAERSDTMVARTIGIALARRLDLPQERFDRLAGEMVDVQRRAERDPWTNDRRLADCGALRRELATLRLRGAIGEVAAMRAALGTSAASSAELLRLGREQRERREAAEASRSASASAASLASAVDPPVATSASGPTAEASAPASLTFAALPDAPASAPAALR